MRVDGTTVGGKGNWEVGVGVVMTTGDVIACGGNDDERREMTEEGGGVSVVMTTEEVVDDKVVVDVEAIMAEEGEGISGDGDGAEDEDRVGSCSSTPEEG